MNEMMNSKDKKEPNLNTIGMPKSKKVWKKLSKRFNNKEPNFIIAK